jgi:hypothetical protein
MKLSSLFNVITDAQDLLDLFDGVTSVDQLRGRLRRVSQLEAEDLLTCLEGLLSSVAAALNDTLEVSPDLGETEDDDPGESSGEASPDLPSTDDLLDEVGDTVAKDQTPDSSPVAEKIKNPTP